MLGKIVYDKKLLFMHENKFMTKHADEINYWLDITFNHETNFKMKDH